jgi:hypothetical protein
MRNQPFRQDLQDGFFGWEDLTINDVLAHLLMQAFNGVGGVDHFAELDPGNQRTWSAHSSADVSH